MILSQVVLVCYRESADILIYRFIAAISQSSEDRSQKIHVNYLLSVVCRLSSLVCFIYCEQGRCNLVYMIDESADKLNNGTARKFGIHGCERDNNGY